MLLPIPLLINALLGLLSLLLLIAAAALFYYAVHRYRAIREVAIDYGLRSARNQQVGGAGQHRTEVLVSSRASRDAMTDRSIWIPLALGFVLLLFTLSGRTFVRLGFRTGADDPKQLNSNNAQTVEAVNGAKIHVEVFGQPDAPTLVFTHGWSTDNTEWYYAKKQLSGQFRLIFWDIPGLGASPAPADKDFSLETMARELNAVVGVANGKPVVLVGHSIGGMINLTYCQLFPDRLGQGIVGLVQVDTSYTNPVTTTKNASLNESLQKPVGEPVLHVMTFVSPVVRALNWLSYENGIAQINNARSSFAGSETWGQVDLIAKYGYQSSPDVVARGTLGMFHWDAKPVLPHIHIPVLILVGQQDTTTLPSASVFMKQAMPHATLESISPSAHYGLLEQNGRYNEAIARFAKTCF